MELLQRLLLALLGIAALLIVAEVCRRRRLAAPPARAVLIALASGVVFGEWIRPLLGSPTYRWLELAEVLLLCFTAVRLGLWVGLEIPGSLGWWRRPPKLLVQLLMVGIGSVITVVVVRQTLKVDLVGLVTTSAVLTAVVGFAAQGLLKDLIAGLELQLGDDFAIGDLVDLGGVQGVVESVSWRDTNLRTNEGTRLVVPNSKITEEVIVNLEAYGYCGNRFSIGLDYAIPPARVRDLLLDLLRNHPLVLADPSPRVRIKDFGDSAMIYEVQVWHPKAVQPGPIDLRSELLEQIWYAVHRMGWSIPFPVRELRAASPAAGAAAAGRGAGRDTALASLARNSLFAVLSAEQQADVLASSARVRYGPGETIVREGDGGDSLFLIVKGSVAVLKRREDGSEFSVCELGGGEVFGEMTLFLDAPRSTTVRALQECELVQVDRDCLSHQIASNPSLMELLAEQVERRLQELKTMDSRGPSPNPPALLATMRRLLMNLRS
jgi:small-conductance mechanosensitive channel